MTNLETTVLWTALITPLNNDFTVDYESLEKLLREQEAAGNGVLILGSTGEALNLSLKIKEDIINFVSKLGLKVPLMAGIGGSDIEATVSWIKFLNQSNIDAYLTVTPLYAKPGDQGQKLWFSRILDAATKPCVLYNVPGRTACSLSIAAVDALKNHPQFFGIKEASGSPEIFSQYVDVANNKRMFCGDDALLPEFARRGASGLISVASNVWPEQTALYTKLALAKELSEEEEGLWNKISQTLFEASNPVPCKALLAELGRIKTDTMALPLSREDLKKLDHQLDAHALVNQWYAKRRESL